ncbi:Glycosyl transferase family 2 [Lachnospiraceae bacterium XBB2008]|nr:Glycosyl transferase family 2 [Lachnospiraceae bacterium XBB2008]
MQKKVSVIVPVYNSEKYLYDCLDSICNQKYSNLEIILVDDGSTDSSGTICDDYAKMDSRIYVIHKKNGGAHNALVAGIEIAEGEFIGFVDSDDWIDSDMYRCLVDTIGDSDLISSGIRWYGKDGTIVQTRYDALPPGIYDAQDNNTCRKFFIRDGAYEGVGVGGITNNRVCKLFRTSLVKSVYRQADQKIVNGEDFLFCFLYLLRCKTIKVIHSAFYNYRYNESSVTHNPNPRFLEERARLYDTMLSAIKDYSKDDMLYTFFQQRFLYELYSMLDYNLGINPSISFPMYRFPNEKLLSGKRIIVFGSGRCGISYIKLFLWNRLCSVVEWIDNNPSTIQIMNISPRLPNTILQTEYDYIVCAINNQNAAQNMIEQLMEMGVNRDVILWEKPINIFADVFLQSHSFDERVC